MMHTLLAKFGNWCWVGICPLALTDATLGSWPYGSLSATALLGWYMYYQTCKAIPRKDAEHAKQFKEQREHYEGILNRQADAHGRQIDALCETLRGEGK